MSFLHPCPMAVISFVVASLMMTAQLSSANNGEACTVDEDCVLEHDYCEDTNGDFTKDTCQCQYGYYFSDGKCWSEDESQPQDPCDQRPCMHGGDCASRDQEFICHCMPGYTGVTCEAELFCKPGTYFDSLHNKCYECELGTYSEKEGKETACQPCPSDDQGVNSTTRDTGAANVTDCVFNPVVDSIFPTYGPVSGGTPIIVTFTHLDTHQVASVQMGERTCQVIQSNATSITCVTSQPHQSDLRGPFTGPLRLTFQDSYVTETLFNFTYMSDPEITSIDNYYTFISGGLTMTIRGQNFDSILSPELKITRFHDGETRLFTSGCSLSNSSVMGCVIPSLAVDMTHRLFSIPTNRQRRAVGIPTFNDRTTQFYAGFNLDGVKTFQNMSVAPGRYPSQLPVYPDPIYYPFEADDMVQDFSPGHHTFLHLEGKYLNAACRVQDVTVTIGQNVCDVTFLATNQLTCLPPDTQPEPDGTGHGPGKTPRVTVYVGNLIYVVGYLSYYLTTDSKNDAAIGAIVAVAVILPVLLIIAIVLVCYRRRQALSRNSKPSRMDSVSMAQSNIYFEPDTHGYSTISHSPNGQAIDHSDSIPPNLSQLPLVHNAQRMARNMSSSVSPPSTPGLVSLDSGDTFGTAYFSNGKSYDIMDEISEDLRLTVQECQLDSGRLTLDDMVGQGYFGKVFKGDLTDEHYHNPKTVAVKTVQGAHSSLKDVTAFLEEAVVMKDFNHPNVLSLLGVTIVNNTPYVILPFMEHGDLKSYIKEPTRRIKVRDLLSFGVLIADGMCYLANQKFVHRDLATRNCMVDKSLKVKIADFGLSRDIYKSDYYRVEDKHRPLPVKWMAVESLTTGVFSTKSDVWAYGVVLWELLTRGCTPYPDVSTFNVKGYLLSGRRLSQPEHAPSDVYELMCRCWMEKPEERPPFDEIYNELKEIINDRHTANHPDYLKLIDA